MQLLKYIAVILAGLATSASGYPSAASAGVRGGAVAARDLTQIEATRVMEFVYQGKTRLAIDYLESFTDYCEGEPF